ncbi:WXG100 family type VII secretion target [Mycobacterium sp. URHB0021]
MSINYQYADVEAHGGLLEAQAGQLEAEHQAILKHLNEASEFWGGVGSSGFQEFVTELNRNFAVIFQELHSHGGKVKTVSGNTAHTDSGVGGTWSV